jgi:hypothetical protein
MNSEDYLKDISEIKNMMSKSSRFISLSGLSGVLAGIYALIGAGYAYWLVTSSQRGYLILDGEVFRLVMIDLFLVCFFGIITGIVLTTRKAKKEGRPIWGPASKRLVINFLIPVVSGGIYTLIILSQDKYGQTAALMLLFYGLGLVNASKYTLGDVKYLGYTEIILGLICAFFPGYGFWLWVIGFGFMHIIYGALMYYKYEKS